MFPDVDPDYARGLVTNTGNPFPVNVACNILLENPQYPRVTKKDIRTSSEQTLPSQSKVLSITFR